MTSSNTSDQAPPRLEQPAGHVSTYFRFGVGKLKTPTGTPAEDGAALANQCIAQLGDLSRFPPRIFIFLPTPSFLPYRLVLTGLRNRLTDRGFGNVPLIGASVAVCVFDKAAHEQGALLLALGSQSIEASAAVGLDAQANPAGAVGEILQTLGLSEQHELNPFSDRILFTFLPGLTKNGLASSHRGGEIIEELRERTYGSLPMFGGVASGGVESGEPGFQFKGDGVFTDAAVVALVDCKIMCGFSLSEGLKETGLTFRVKTVTKQGQIISEFYEGSARDIIAKLPQPRVLGERSVDGDLIVAVPELVGDQLHIRRSFPAGTVVHALAPDLPGLRHTARKAVERLMRRSHLRVSRVAGFWGIGCVARYRQRNEIGVDITKAIDEATKQFPGVELAGCYMEGEVGPNRLGRSVLGNWTVAVALFADDVPEHSEVQVGFGAFATQASDVYQAQSVDEAIERILNGVRAAGYPGGMISLVLRDRDSQWIVARKAFGAMWVDKLLHLTRRELPGQDVLAIVASKKKARYVRDSSDPKECCDPKAVVESGILSQYIIPLLDKDGKTIALLQVDLGDMRDTLEAEVGKQQKAVLDAIGGLAAAALNRVIHTDELEITRELDRALIECLGSETPDEAVGKFVLLAAEILGTDSHVRLAQPGSTELRLVGGKGNYYEAAKKHRLVIDVNDRSPSAEAVRCGEISFSNDADNDESALVMRDRYIEGPVANALRAVKAFANFPIALPGEKPRGLFNLTSGTPWFFNESTLRSLADIGHRLALLLAHIEQRREAQESVGKLTFLLNITPQLGKGADVHEALAALVQHVRRASNAEVISCFLWSEDLQRFVLRAQSGWVDPRWIGAAWYAIGEGMTGKLASAVEPRYIPDLKGFKRDTHEEEGKYLDAMFGTAGSESHTHEVIALPLAFQKKSLGIVTMHRLRLRPTTNQPTGFTTVDDEMLREVCERLSAFVFALAESDLVQWRHREANRLYKVQAALLQGKKVEVLLSDAARRIVEEYAAIACSVYLTDTAGEHLLLKAHEIQNPFPSEVHNEASKAASPDADSPTLSHILSTGTTQMHTHPDAVDQSDPSQVRLGGVTSRLCIPVGTPERVLGALDVWWSVTAAGDTDRVLPHYVSDSLKQVAEGIASAINAHQLREERETSLQAAKTARDALDGMALVLQKSFHDLAKGVQGISSGLSDIQRLGANPSQALSFEECHRIVEKLARVLQEAQEIGWRLAVPQRRIYRVDGLLHEAINRHQGAAAQASVKIDCGELKEASAEVDCTLIAKCFDNIIENSIEAMPQGGRVECSMRMPQGSHICEIVISDTGKGMSQEQMADALRTKPEAPRPWAPGEQVGGVGLFLTQLYCRSHGGNTKVVSHPGSGTTVIMTIPAQG